MDGKTTGTALAAADQELEALRAERDRLRFFVQALLEDFPESAPDQFEIQDLAVNYGLLEGVEVTESCGEECWCAAYGDFPQTCYRPTELLTGREG